MNSQELRALQEAYIQVYELDEATAMAKRGKDETEIRNTIAKKTGASGAGKFADKATALADRGTYGDNKKQDDREKLARAQRGDFRKTTSSSPGLRGYAHQSSDPAVKAKQAARGNQRADAALTPNERKKLNMEYDLYDIILSHLLDEGYADTEQAAEAIMVNMSEDWRESIVEARMDPRGRPASGPMNVYANPKGKPDQAHLDAIKSYDEKQKKKTPEQRKAELDAYKERQLNNK